MAPATKVVFLITVKQSQLHQSTAMYQTTIYYRTNPSIIQVPSLLHSHSLQLTINAATKVVTINIVEEAESKHFKSTKLAPVKVKLMVNRLHTIANWIKIKVRVNSKAFTGARFITRFMAATSFIFEATTTTATTIITVISY